MGLELSTSYIFSLKHHSICASIYILTVQVIGLKSTIRNLPAIFLLLPTLCVKATFGSCASFIAIKLLFCSIASTYSIIDSFNLVFINKSFHDIHGINSLIFTELKIMIKTDFKEKDQFKVFTFYDRILQ